jgi:hypothetical protein
MRGNKKAPNRRHLPMQPPSSSDFSQKMGYMGINEDLIEILSLKAGTNGDSDLRVCV